MNRPPAGKKIYLEPMDHDASTIRDAQFPRQYWRQLLPANQRNKVQFSVLEPSRSPRDDGLRVDLNFVAFEDDARVHPEEIYLAARQNRDRNEFSLYCEPPCAERSLASPSSSRKRSTRYLLDYIRQMEENYAAMERELTRARMLPFVMAYPVTPQRRALFWDQKQPERNWTQCPLAKKYGQSMRTRPEVRERGSHGGVKSQRICDPPWETTGAGRGRNIDGGLNDTASRKCPAFAKYPERCPHFSKSPCDRVCRPKTLENDATAVCSVHNIAVIYPQGSDRSNGAAKPDEITSKEGNVLKTANKCLATEDTFVNGTPRTSSPFENESGEKTLMEACQSYTKKREPETSRGIDFDVKQEDRVQASLGIAARKSRSLLESEPGDDRCDSDILRRPIFEDRFSRERRAFVEKVEFRRGDVVSQEDNGLWNNRARKSPYDRPRYGKEPMRASVRLMRKNVRTQKRTPTPRSTVHTAYTPMAPSYPTNPVMDPNGFTIQLLRLAVLLYAPALMPALNSLIARQNSQTSIPIPCFEGPNDLLGQVFRILSNQQCIPNLPYAPAVGARFGANSNLNRAEPTSWNQPENFETPGYREIAPLPERIRLRNPFGVQNLQGQSCDSATVAGKVGVNEMSSNGETKLRPGINSRNSDASSTAATCRCKNSRAPFPLAEKRISSEERAEIAKFLLAQTGTKSKSSESLTPRTKPTDLRRSEDERSRD